MLRGGPHTVPLQATLTLGQRPSPNAGFLGASSGMLSAAYAGSATCPCAADNGDQTDSAAEDPLMMRMTRHEAAARLAVSEATPSTA